MIVIPTTLVTAIHILNFIWDFQNGRKTLN